MFRKLYSPAVFALLSLSTLVSCDDDEKKPSLRPSIDYNTLSATTGYSQQFVDASNNTTVDLREGNTLHQMFRALNYYNVSSVTANTQVDAQKLNDLFSNTGNPFYDISSTSPAVNVVGADLNSSGLELRENVASSLAAADAEAVRTKIESLFDEMATASESVNGAASKGVAGKSGSYLLDGKGIEVAQVIQKSLIGALQLDYIGNILLDEGLTADNSKAVTEENYTAREHNWDIAYGLLTLNQIYLENYTNDAKGVVEFAAGSYLWEYNRANYAKFFPALLRGRAAIVNNDNEELEEQATYLRTELEKTMAYAAIAYLEKAKAEASFDKKAHAFAEGLGFIYSLRFAKLHNVDAAFSDALLNDLTGSEFGLYDLETADFTAAADAIRTKFNIQ